MFLSKTSQTQPNRNPSWFHLLPPVSDCSTLTEHSFKLISTLSQLLSQVPYCQISNIFLWASEGREQKINGNTVEKIGHGFVNTMGCFTLVQWRKIILTLGLHSSSIRIFTQETQSILLNPNHSWQSCCPVRQGSHCLWKTSLHCFRETPRGARIISCCPDNLTK